MLEVKNLSVSAEEKLIINNLSLDFTVDPGRLFVLFGPNGCGKSTLFRSLMGFSQYHIQGDILLEGVNIKKKTIDQRVNSGLVYMYQTPPKLKGLTLENISREISDVSDKEISSTLSVFDFYSRDINSGLSGGEVKRSELFTLSLIKTPKVFLFDEPDSGVDIDNLKIIGKYIEKLLQKNKAMGIIITHNGDILKYLKAQKGAVMYNGQIVCQGDPKELLDCIKKDGYKGCVNCKKKKIC